MKINPIEVTVDNDAVLQEVATLPRADEVGVGRLLLHCVDIQEQKDSAIPAAEGAVKFHYSFQ